MTKMIDGEKCWFLLGRKLGRYYFGRIFYHSKGSAFSVDFDWEVAVKKSVLGFYHTHIDGDPYLSTEDETTMRAWVRSEGRPLLCGVITDNSQKCWVFYRKEKLIRHMEIRSLLIGSFFIGHQKGK